MGSGVHGVSGPGVQGSFSANGVSADCKFSHPAPRPSPKAQKPFGAKSAASPYKRPTNGNVQRTVMNISKKFGAAAEKKLDPGTGEFKPSEGEKEVQVA